MIILNTFKRRNVFVIKYTIWELYFYAEMYDLKIMAAIVISNMIDSKNM